MRDDIVLVVGADPGDPDDVRRDAAVWSALPPVLSVLLAWTVVAAILAAAQAAAGEPGTLVTACVSLAVGLALTGLLTVVLLRGGPAGWADPVAACAVILAAAPAALGLALTDEVAWSLGVILAATAAGALLLSVRWLVAALYAVWLCWLVALAVAELVDWPVLWLAGGAALTALGILVCVSRRRLVHALSRAEETASLASVRDSLTGLANRRGLTMLGQQMVEVARRQGDAVHCVYVDIDQLAHVNEVVGHDAGDEVVVAVADALRAVTRSTDVVARWGGDEFCVLGPGAGMAPMELERRIRERVMHNPPVPDAVWSPRVCAGGAMLAPWDSGTLDTLLGKADQEMYLRRALRRGGSRPKAGQNQEQPQSGA
ncbi:MAG: GGDEF domain-containing protein [Actinomycetes bacterium]